MEKKLIWKFNIIDLLIIGIVALGIAVLFFRIASDNGGEKTEFVFTCVCEAEPELLSEIQSGQQCINRATNDEFGIVAAVLSSDNKILITASGRRAKHGVSVSGSNYLKGQEIEIITGDSLLRIKITEIKEASQAGGFRLSKKSRKVWAFSSSYGIMFLGDKNDAKRI